jgi:poly(A) polymerase Pap1
LLPDTSSEVLSSALEECLKTHCCYETPAGLTRRKEVLSSLNLLVRQWIQSISLARGLAWQDLPRMGGRIVTYG